MEHLRARFLHVRPPGSGAAIIPRRSNLQITVHQDAVKPVLFQPVIEGNLIKAGCYNFLAELVSFCIQKRYSESRQSSDKRIRSHRGTMDAVAIAEKQEANGIATQTQGHIRCSQSQPVSG